MPKNLKVQYSPEQLKNAERLRHEMAILRADVQMAMITKNPVAMYKLTFDIDDFIRLADLLDTGSVIANDILKLRMLTYTLKILTPKFIKVTQTQTRIPKVGKV